MRITLKEKRLSHLVVQRNVLAGLSLTLLAVTCLQTTLLFFKSEKTIIHPPELKQSYWVEGNRFSPIYLEEMALYYAHLLLDVSQANILYQGDVLLRYVAPDEYDTFKYKLLTDQKRLKKENLALAFSPSECQVYPDKLAVDITGDLVSFVSGKKISQHRETYQIQFSSKAGRLFLSSVNLIETDRPKEKSDETDPS